MLEVAPPYQIFDSVFYVLTIVRDITVISVEIAPLGFITAFVENIFRSLPLIVLLMHLVDLGSTHHKGSVIVVVLWPSILALLYRVTLFPSTETVILLVLPVLVFVLLFLLTISFRPLGRCRLVELFSSDEYISFTENFS